MKTTTDHAAPLEIETETRTVEANGWVEAGEYHTAYFRHQPENVKGCPAGRSQHSAAPAPRTLHLRRDPAGQWQYQTREAGEILICWQYGGYDRAETIAQAASRFSFDRVEA